MTVYYTELHYQVLLDMNRDTNEASTMVVMRYRMPSLHSELFLKLEAWDEVLTLFTSEGFEVL